MHFTMPRADATVPPVAPRPAHARSPSTCCSASANVCRSSFTPAHDFGKLLRHVLVEDHLSDVVQQPRREQQVHVGDLQPLGEHPRGQRYRHRVPPEHARLEPVTRLFARQDRVGVHGHDQLQDFDRPQIEHGVIQRRDHPRQPEVRRVAQLQHLGRHRLVVADGFDDVVHRAARVVRHPDQLQGRIGQWGEGPHLRQDVFDVHHSSTSLPRVLIVTRPVPTSSFSVRLIEPPTFSESIKTPFFQKIFRNAM